MVDRIKEEKRVDELPAVMEAHPMTAVSGQRLFEPISDGMGTRLGEE